MKIKKLISFCLLLVLVISCTNAPISGRKQLLLVSEQEIITQSYSQYNEIIAHSKVLNNSNSKLVKKVGNKIAKAVDEYFKKHPEQKTSQFKYQWEFNLIEDKTPNAWCMPGGKVAVYTGILPYTKDETGLAVVMSHEIAHAIAEHGREQASYSVLQNLGSSILNSMGLSTGIYNGASNLVLLSYSREHETEADELGLIFMKLAGYNPNYAITFWERMKSSSNNAQLEFLSTHPSDTTRINNIKNFLQSEKFKQIKK
ncbi:M48 family metallopeptidase [uncultured Fusobacterium sp.]|uniref:M48 family metallopeptidase n=1 Tax=uncultured Fusobacterium sp. TaxID=159267 RepID=UPI0025E5D3B9|nr:M48 family metallopeptidase [uncultured Fusobacterium sp.]